MKRTQVLSSSSVLPYVGIALTLGLTVFAGPALAEIPTGGIETITTDLWDFFIQNIGLMIVGLAILGALIGAMVANPGRGIATAICAAAIGAFIGAVPTLAEYVIGLGA